MDESIISANEIVPRTLWHTALLWCGLIGSILFNVVYFSFGAIAVHYNMMRQPIGDLMLLHSGWLQSANFIVFGLSTGVFAIALAKELRGGFGAVLIPAFHLATGLGAILMGLMISEPLHTYISVLTFVTLPFSFVLLAGRFTGDARWPGWAAYTNLTNILMLLFFVVFWIARINERPYAGVYERLIVVTRLIWVAIFILRLIGGRRLTPLKRI